MPKPRQRERKLEMSKEERKPFDIICEIIAEEMDINPQDITEEMSFDEDLDMDRNSIMQVLVACEMEFGIDYEQADFEDIRTVGDILKSLEEW